MPTNKAFRRAMLALMAWMISMTIFVIAIVTVVLQIEFRMTPIPWLIQVTLITGIANVGLFVVFIWLDRKIPNDGE